MPAPLSILQRLRAAWRRRRAIGRRGERAAERFLKKQGYRVLQRNVRNRVGEIDLLAQDPDGRTIVVVEVKTTEVAGQADHVIPPEVHVNRRKQRKLASLACLLVRRSRFEDRPVRFDVVGVHLPPRGRPVIRHHVAAFESFL